MRSGSEVSLSGLFHGAKSFIVDYPKCTCKRVLFDAVDSTSKLQRTEREWGIAIDFELRLRTVYDPALGTALYLYTGKCIETGDGTG